MVARSKRNGRGGDSARNLSSEALRGVCVILLFALAGFLMLASIGFGGYVGSFLYEWLSWLLGIGYMALPLSLFLLSIAIARSFERHFGVMQVASVAVFLLSTLGLINLVFSGHSGILGSFVSKAFVIPFDTVAAIIFLTAFAVVALIVAFDIRIDIITSRIRNLLRPATQNRDSHGEQEYQKYEEQREEVASPLVNEVSSESSAVIEHASQEEISREQPAARPNSEETLPAAFPIIAARGETYTPPPLSYLSKNRGKPEVGDIKANMNIIKRTLQNFGIRVEMDEASIGPTVTRYAMKPAEGVRLAKIVALQSNLELALAASPIRIEAPIPGKSLVGIEVPNIARTTLGLAPLLSDESFTHSDKPLLMALGRTISGSPFFADLARMPHLLVAGTTGAGKSVAIHNFIISLLYRCSPERLRFIMVDPKRVELTLYNSIPHLFSPVITDAKKAIAAIRWLSKEMERRYNILETEAVRDISSYHKNIVARASATGTGAGTSGINGNGTQVDAMPYIVVIIDELADIMSVYPRELESGIVRLAQMSRAVGIHLILSTQRPSVKVITGLIKANIPVRIAFQVASQIDSRTILDMGGAEKLLGAGDMLFLSSEMSKPRRLQAPLVSEDEVKRVVGFVARHGGDAAQSEINFNEMKTSSDAPGDVPPFSLSEIEEEDELYSAAKQTVIEAGKASTSYLQRKLGIGYARAARLMDLLEERGVIGPADGAKPREVLQGKTSDSSVARRETEPSTHEESVSL